MTTWSNQSKNSSTYNNVAKTNSEIIYFVMEDGFYYLVGSAEDETLVTQDVIQWTYLTKN